VYLFFLERYQNFLSLPYCAFFLILYQPQSAEFCEIVVAENRIGVNVLLSSWFILEFWVVASVRWMKCDSFLPCFRQMDDYPYATIGADGWFRCDGLHRPGFPPCFRTCCTASATRVFPRTVAVHTISSGWGAARSMWTFRLTPPTQP
jgi:hypothetical protein